MIKYTVNTTELKNLTRLKKYENLSFMTDCRKEYLNKNIAPLVTLVRTQQKFRFANYSFLFVIGTRRTQLVRREEYKVTNTYLINAQRATCPIKKMHKLFIFVYTKWRCYHIISSTQFSSKIKIPAFRKYESHYLENYLLPLRISP